MVSFCLDSSFTALGTPPYALPTSGILHSKLTPRLIYQLASATGNNVLQLSASHPTGVLTFVTPRAASNLYILQTATYATAAITVDMAIRFTDSTSQLFPGQLLYDWYTPAQPDISGIGRIFGALTTGGQIAGALQGDSAHPALSQTLLTVAAANINKPVAYITFTQTGFSPGPGSLSVCDMFAISIQPSATTLPVTLTNFKGQEQGSANLLSWTTTIEINNKGFELQRSADGSNFSTLSFIPSQAVNGNSSASLNYQSIDAQPLATDNYYRLKQVDKDGTATYSSTVLVKAAVTTNIAVTLYPNPVTDQLHVTITSKEHNNVVVLVNGLDGKTIITQQLQLVPGTNTIAVNASTLLAGTYALTIKTTDGHTLHTGLFVK